MDLLAEYSLLQIGVAALAALGASFVRGLTGFGMAILLVPVLALALPPIDAVMLGNFLSLLIGVLEIRRLIREAERSAWVISGAVVVTTPIGLVLLSATGADLARLVIAMIAFSAFVAILLPRRSAGSPGPVTTGSVGVISGLMTGYAGMPGPPVVPYYAGRALPRETIKASMLLIFTIAAGVALLAAAFAGLLRLELTLGGRFFSRLRECSQQWYRLTEAELRKEHDEFFSPLCGGEGV
ncbi:MAG: TSUP family transporter, partial [Pseudomonadota bacterium]